MRKGNGTVIQSNSGRSRLNIHGAMNAEKYETTIVSSEANINTDPTIGLFEYLIFLYSLATTIYVILDNAKYYFLHEMQEWVKNLKTHALHFLQIKKIIMFKFFRSWVMGLLLWCDFKPKTVRRRGML